MENKLPREFFWVDKTKMSEFLKEPQIKKLYEVYLGIKRKTPSQDYQTLKLFNEVHYLCSKIVYENNADVELNTIICDARNNLGWDYSTSIVINMIYCILSLRKNNSEEILSVIKKIEKHYRLDQYKTPFYLMVLDCKEHGEFFDFVPNYSQEKILSTKEIPINIVGLNHRGDIHITLNLNNQYTGEIKSINVNSPGNIVGKEIKI